MSRINTNVSSLIAQRSLAMNNQKLQTSLQRLSTGLKINTGADDPAGLIASEGLKAEQTGITQAIDNANRANNMIGTAEGGLNEVSNLLNQLGGLVNQSANTGGMSQDEIAANQLQVDSILSTINRIAGGTSFQGQKLLNGSFDYTTSSVAASAFTTMQINAANLPSNKTESVVVQVTNSATLGKLTFAGSISGTHTYISGSAVTLEVAGNKGTQQLSFAGSSTISSIATAINNITGVTGVTASATAGKLTFITKDYGSKDYVSVKTVSGTFAVTGGTSGKATGTNAAVIVNGAQAQADGTDITYRDANLDVSFKLSSGLNNGKSKTFGVTGGGATFALGSKVTDSDKVSIGIADVSTGNLGDSVIGYLSSLGSGGSNSLSAASLTGAQSIIDKSIGQVAQLRGRLGAFQKFTLGSTINSLGVAYENVSASESAIVDTDFAAETANLTRSQVLQQAASMVLAQANAAPQSALSLLH
jgi:flagellin